MEKENKEIPFGAKDSELYKFEYTIPEGYEAEIKDGKVLVKKKESEDERIRKELIDHCIQGSKQRTIVSHKEDYKRWLAWLEKQKEQKPIKKEKVWTIYDAKEGDVLNSTRVQATIIFKGFADDGKHILAYCALQKGFFLVQELPWDRDFEPASEYWKNALYDAMTEKGYSWDADNLELKKIEQKPAEWSEKHIADIFEKVGLAKIVREQGNDVLTNALQDAMLELSKSGTAEWSEEDEVMREAILDTLERVGDYGTIGMQKDWLKSLRPQPKQEWSEEDEKMFQSVSGTIEYAYGKTSKVTQWLKSLHPQSHWKPSEHQLEVLKLVAEKDGTCLMGLYNDLKKL